MTLDVAAAARGASPTLAGELGLGVEELAEGICDVINAKMAQAIRTLTVEQGIEPRDFALVAFGGAGPMHAAFLARELEIARGHRPGRPRRVLRLGHAGDARSARTSAGRSTPRARDADRAELAAAAPSSRATGFDALDGEGMPADTRPRASMRSTSATWARSTR